MSDAVKGPRVSIGNFNDNGTSPVVIVEHVKLAVLNLAKDRSWVQPEYYEVYKEQGDRNNGA